ncbi:MAG: 3-hydroxybutyryl-CoA dehydrogenase [Bacteroidetes bacterium]|nr:MAG: 3-hydroxybutyryl-CoA dehydrogenase [Bacteroidota bacterium]
MQHNINTICVCGAGTMGTGIALCAAQHGFTAIVFDINPATLASSQASVQQTLRQLLAKQKITAQQQHDIFNRLSFTAHLQQATAPLIIEAIVEQYAAKQQLFQQLATINGHNCIFASNTSSLSITQLQAQIPHPHRVVGMHFFNPATLMKLVEVVKGQHTSATTIQTATAVATAMGKTAVQCTNSPGFIVNRVARPYYLEAMRLLQQGVATPQQIDAILESTGFKMGPFKLMDLIGIDVNHTVSTQLWEALGHPPRLQPAALQQALVDAGQLGRKTGKGFYHYQPQP